MTDPEVFLAPDEADTMRQRWSDIQAAFVDEPRQAVERADGLVDEVLKRVADGFSSRRAALEQQWGRGDEATTDDLRITLQRYRAFFERLLKV
jgi:hypothetical protein